MLVNRALGREPDTEAINGVHRSLLLDVPEDRADYSDLVEAVLPHDYYLDDADEQEHYRADALDALSFTPGIHLSGTSGFFVDADGRVVRGTGFLDEQNRRYYRCDESGRILADYAPHYLEGHAVFVRRTAFCAGTAFSVSTYTMKMASTRPETRNWTQSWTTSSPPAPQRT